MDIHLNLKKEWFDYHLDNKTEEYRAITPYWCNRLLLFKGIRHSMGFWEEMLLSRNDVLFRFIYEGTITFQLYEVAVFSNGYSAVLNLPRFKKRILFIEISRGHILWGAAPNTFYFTIAVGDPYDLVNCTRILPMTKRTDYGRKDNT